MKRKLPPNHPDVIAKKAAELPWKEDARVDIFPYEKAILTMRERGYSYGEIAKWLTEAIGAPVKRGQVYYVCKVEAVEAQQRFEAGVKRGEYKEMAQISLSDEEAEKIARNEDNWRKRRAKKS